MIRYYSFFILFFVLLCGQRALAQKGVFTVGLQFKPVVPISFFNDVATVVQDDISAEMKPTFGYSFGMNVRRGIGDLFALETGINYIQRNFDYKYQRGSFEFQESGDITFVGYEIPLLALFYVRLGEQTFMNVSGGVAADMFPSDAVTTSDELRVFVFRKNWIQASVMANVGFEMRTRKSGYFVVGATYHRPFTTMAVTEFTHYDGGFPGGFPSSVRTDLTGTYLTLDLRYLFHDKGEKKKREIDRKEREGF